ncbi:MAG: pyruvate kinase [Candidatus Micrarchaeota archaeon]
MRKTKILCTLGPASSDSKTIRELKDAGMNAARLNFSHGTMQEHAATAESIKKIRGNDALAIVLDLPGPKIRVGELENKAVLLKAGEAVKITSKPVIGTKGLIPVNCPDVSQMAEVGELVFFDDGKIELEIMGKAKEVLECTVVIGGELLTRKGFNAPGMHTKTYCLTPRDFKGVQLANKIKPEFVAQSFVCSAGDVKAMRRKLSPGIGLIAKIENTQALLHFDEILEVVDAIMVARGDLGIQTPIENLPIVQKEIISKCNKAAVPVITATQMLESMVNHPNPTRAEVTDVANAVFDGTDCVMLSGETAMGIHPARVVKVMSRIAETAEKHPDFFTRITTKTHSLSSALALGASKLAADVQAKAIVSCTLSGKTAQLVSRDKPGQPIIAVTDNEVTFRKLALSWGVEPCLIKTQKSAEDLVEAAVKASAVKLKLVKGDKVVVTSGRLLVTGTTNMLRVESV